MKELLLDNISNNFVVDKNENFFINNFDGKKDIQITLNENVESVLSMLSLSGYEGKINIKINKDSRLEIYYADFAKNITKTKVNISLEKGAKVIFHLASLTVENSNKLFTVSVDHDAINTYSLIDNYGVVKGNGKLVFDGTSYIKNGSVKSKTRHGLLNQLFLLLNRNQF